MFFKHFSAFFRVLSNLAHVIHFYALLVTQWTSLSMYLFQGQSSLWSIWNIWDPWNHCKSLLFCFSSSILCTCEDVPAFLSGETGIGKSTLIDTLFNTNFEDHESSHFYPHVRLKAQTYELQESNVRLKLTIVNTVGFGDQINKEERYTLSSCNK